VPKCGDTSQWWLAILVEYTFEIIMHISLKLILFYVIKFPNQKAFNRTVTKRKQGIKYFHIKKKDF